MRKRDGGSKVADDVIPRRKPGQNSQVRVFYDGRLFWIEVQRCPSAPSLWDHLTRVQGCRWVRQKAIAAQVSLAGRPAVSLCTVYIDRNAQCAVARGRAA